MPTESEFQKYYFFDYGLMLYPHQDTLNHGNRRDYQYYSAKSRHGFIHQEKA